MRKHFIIVIVAIWFIGGIISLWLGFPVCFTPGHEAAGFIIPMPEVKQALSNLGFPTGWIPSTQHVIRKEELNVIDSFINAFAYYEVFFLGLIGMIPKIIPFFSEMFSGGWWPILSGALEIAFIFTLGLASAVVVLGFELLFQTSSLDYKIVYLLATLPALAVGLLVVLGTVGMILGTISGSSGSGGAVIHDEAIAANPRDLLVGTENPSTIFMDKGGLFDEESIGRIDKEGNIYQAGLYIGRIDKEGNIYRNTGFLDERIGSIDKEGNIYRADLLDELIGHIDKEGNIFMHEGFFDDYVGRIAK